MSQVNITRDDLQAILETVLAKSNQLNPLEQKKYDEEMAKQRRRDLLAVEVGRAEEEAQRRKRNSCSHLRYPATAGKLSGQSAPRGTPGAEYTTGGQAYQNGLAMMFCTRCQTQWWFKPTQDYYTIILQEGLSSTAPPLDDQCICIGCFELKSQCKCVEHSKEYVAAHPTVA